MNILVLCTGNSARSILLESILNVQASGRITAYSAGSQPAGQVNPAALTRLESAGHPTSGFRSKSWDEFGTANAPKMDIVITVCGSAANETCPIWPGAPVTAHWGVEDPAAVTGTNAEIAQAFDTAFKILEHRAKAFLALPFETLSRETLKAELARIGGLHP